MRKINSDKGSRRKMEIEKVDGAPSAGGTVYLDVVPAEGESGTPIGDDVPRGTYVIDNHKYTSREKVRLLTLKPGVQFTIVICALIDIFMLLAQVRTGCPLLHAHAHMLSTSNSSTI